MRRFSQIKTWDRAIIAKCHKRRMSVSEIARATGFHKSTISRELARNRKNKFFRYRADWAQEERDERSRAAMKKRRGTIRPDSERWIRQKLAAKWSPEQISGRSAIDGPQRVSHEFIYQFIARDKERGGRLFEHLRTSQKRRYRFKSPAKRSKIPNRVDISTRPKIVNKRKRLGDLEGDLIVGRHQRSHIVVVADRVSRLVGIEKVRVKSKREVNRELHRIIKRNGRGKTLTLDNGLEFSGHEQLAKKARVKIYFAHAYAAWERGTVENMNGLLRQFLPKRTDFRSLSEKRLREIESAINNRPRKCLRYRTPIERHYHSRS